MKIKTYFLDTNILMYAVGSEHPHKRSCLEIFRRASLGKINIVTDTEVFQEIAHRYWCQNKWGLATQVFTDFTALFSEIFSVEKNDLPVFYDFLTKYKQVSPRDAIHLAVMKREHYDRLVTVDRDFLAIKEVTVIAPDEVAA